MTNKAEPHNKCMQPAFDEVLKRMLEKPPAPHRPKHAAQPIKKKPVK
jgi:hypothetical protein